MSGAQIAADVGAALREVAGDVGGGPFAVTLTRNPIGGTPWVPPFGESTTFALAALVQDYPRSMIDGTLIEQQDRRVMVEAAGVVPQTSDILTIQGVMHRVISIKEIAPSGVALFFEVQARK